MSDQDTQDVFAADQQAGTDVDTQQQQTAEPDKQTALEVPESVQDLVGSGKKYNDVQSALNSIKPAQEHINRLEQDNKDLREQIDTLKQELSARQSVADVLEKLDGKGGDQTTDKFDPDQIKQLVYGALKEEKIASTAQSNINAVNKALFDKYGEKAKEKVASKAQELGVSVKRMQEIASESPKAVLAYFNDDTPVDRDPNPTKNNVSATANKPRNTGGSSWEEIRAELAAKYGSN